MKRRVGIVFGAVSSWATTEEDVERNLESMMRVAAEVKARKRVAPNVRV